MSIKVLQIKINIFRKTNIKIDNYYKYTRVKQNNKCNNIAHTQ